MRRHIILPLLMALVLTGCNNSGDSSALNSSSSTSEDSSLNVESSESSKEENSSSTEASSSEEASSESSKDETENSSSSQENNKDIATLEKVNDAMGKLLSVNGHAKKAKISQLEASYYLTDALPLEMKVKSEGEANHYVLPDSTDEISTIDSSYYMFDDSLDDFKFIDKTHVQMSYDDKYFYRITDYESDDYDDVLEKFKFNKDGIDLFLDFGFGMIECANLAQFADFVGHPQAYTEIRGIDGYTKNGTWELSYMVKIFEQGTKIVKQSIIYNDVLTIKNGVIVKAYQQIENALYAGGDKTNWKISETTFEYTHGDYDTYNLPLLNPNDYKEAK